MFPQDGNGFLQEEVVGVGDQLPGSLAQVDMVGPDILYGKLTVSFKVLIPDTDPVPDFERKGKKQDDPGRDVAENRPAGKKGHPDNGKY